MRTKHVEGMASSVNLVYRHRVRYHEADPQGFLFNSRYLELADVAMTEYFRCLGFPYKEFVAAGNDPSVVSAKLQFAAPARFEDELSISASCEQVGRSSFALAMDVWRDGTRLAQISVTYVNVDAATATSRPLPDAVASALRRDSTRTSDTIWKSNEGPADRC